MFDDLVTIANRVAFAHTRDKGTCILTSYALCVVLRELDIERGPCASNAHPPAEVLPPVRLCAGMGGRPAMPRPLLHLPAADRLRPRPCRQAEPLGSLGGRDHG